MENKLDRVLAKQKELLNLLDELSDIQTFGLAEEQESYKSFFKIKVTVTLDGVTHKLTMQKD